MAKDRTGKFWWEYDKPHYITLQSQRGVYDPALTSDCRCGRECHACEFGNCCELRPWMVLCSAENWGEEILTPDGLPDGDIPNPDAIGIPFEDRLACDIFGTPYYLYDGEEVEDDAFIELIEQERENEEIRVSFAEIENEDDNQVTYPGDVLSTGEESAAVQFAEMRAEDEIDELMHEALTMEIHPLEKVNGYDHRLDELPSHLSKSHQIVAKCPDWETQKSYRMDCRKNGSYSNGWRGNDRYKNKRNGKIRVSRRKLRRIAQDIGHPFVYDLPRGLTPRVPTV